MFSILVAACYQYRPELLRRNRGDILAVLPTVVQRLEDDSRSVPMYADLNSGALRLDVRVISALLCRATGVGIDSATLRKVLGRDFVNFDHRTIVPQRSIWEPLKTKDVFVGVDSIVKNSDGIRVVGWSSMHKRGTFPGQYVGYGATWIFQFVWQEGQWILVSQKIRTIT
jgi:hypothetical protein